MNLIKITSLAAFALIMLFVAVKSINTENLDSIATIIGSQQKLVYADCITAFSDAPLSSFAVTEISLNNDHNTDALVRFEDGDSCGSAGCVHELCISDGGGYTHIPFGFAAKQITAEETTTNGMKDLILNNDKTLRMNWDEGAYVLSTN